MLCCRIFREKGGFRTILHSSEVEHMNIKNPKDYSVFIIHGRNLKALDAIVKFIETFDLTWLDMEKARELTGKASPTIFEKVHKGIEEAQAVVILFTPDEQAGLRNQFANSNGDREAGFQPRPNVLYEAGVAFAIARQERTIFIKMGKTRAVSDLAGIEYIELTNGRKERRNFAKALKDAGLPIDLSKDYFNPEVSGNFEFVDSESQPINLLEVGTVEGKEIFLGSIDYLKAKPRGEVLIYAPTGVWENDAAKKKWFATIAGSLAKHSNIPQNRWPKGADRRVTTTLGHFIGVYGLPVPKRNKDNDEITEEQRKEFSKNLDYIEAILMPFNGLKNAELYYLEIDRDSVPGTGTIIIDNSIAVGYAVNTKHKVDYGLFFNEEQRITTNIKNWFNYHVMHIARDYVIQSMKDGMSVAQGFDEIRKHHFLPLKHRARSI